jgi:predicted metal-dependent phosphoesterase TrpH
VRFDLQSHSTRSDGVLEPAEVVAAAAQAGVQLLALSDHDTLAGVPEALKAGAEHGIAVVPAIEISAIDDPSLERGSAGPEAGSSARETGSAAPETGSSARETGSAAPETGSSARETGSAAPETGSSARETGPTAPETGDDGESGPARELHILGYLIDHTDPQLTTTLAGFLADREQRTLRMAENLRKLGIELDRRAIDARVQAGEPIGRPHLAEAALAHPANAERLREEQIDDIGSFIKSYLIEGRPAFALRVTPTVAEAIDAIHAAGGVAIWAHPFWDVEDPDEVLAMVERFRGLGIDGIEAFYVTHTQAQTELLARRCEELGLLSTGSADFHGPENRLFSRFMAFETYELTPNLGPIDATG